MLFQTDSKNFGASTLLVVHLLLTPSCRGQSQLIGSSQPIVATLGDDIILPCHLEPAKDVAAMTLEWSRPDLDPRFVYIQRSGCELEVKKHRSLKGRTSMFIDKLKSGNISLKVSRVKLSDQGTYRCFIPRLDREALVQLVVGAASSPVITSISQTTGGLELQCESGGWYPEPELLWLDSEGHLLPAGPPQTLRGPEDLYNISSRVTVEKRDRSFTCRVQQKDINQTRETHFLVPEEFFKTPSTCTAWIVVSGVLGFLFLFSAALLVRKRK